MEVLVCTTIFSVIIALIHKVVIISKNNRIAALNQALAKKESDLKLAESHNEYLFQRLCRENSDEILNADTLNI